MGLWRTASAHTVDKTDKQSIASADQKSILDRTPSQNDPVASANQAAGTAWLAGHLNHLTPEQEAKLVEFKTVCEQKGYYRPERDGEPASHDDATLLYVFSFWFKKSSSELVTDTGPFTRRFLRARKFDVNGAFNQFTDTEEWRKDNNIESLYENIDVESYEDSRRMVSLLLRDPCPIFTASDV
jgi:hypothetical protein